MMKNDITYEYRVFTNRFVDVESMEVGKCTLKVLKDLKSKDKVDGRFFHTSDTDEWFFCWNGKLQKLNLKGNADVNSALKEAKELVDKANENAAAAVSAATAATAAANNALEAAGKIDEVSQTVKDLKDTVEANKTAIEAAVELKDRVSKLEEIDHKELINEAVAALETAIAAETTARTEADAAITATVEANKTAIEAALASEKAVRAEEDAKLAAMVAGEAEQREGELADMKAAYTEAIAAETTARTEADAALSTTVEANKTAIETALAEEAKAREDEDAKLAAMVAGEAEQREGEMATMKDAYIAAIDAAKAESASLYQVKGEYLTKDAADKLYVTITNGSGESIDLSKYAEIEYVDKNFDAAGSAETAEQNAKAYADSLVKDDEGNVLFDATGAAATAEQNAKDYADSLSTNYDAAGSAAAAIADAAEKYQVKGNYLTEHQDISGKQDVIDDLNDIRNNAALAKTALQVVPDEYVTETELAAKGYLTDHQSLDNYYTKAEVYTQEEIDAKIQAINDLIGGATKYIKDTILA